MATLQEYMNRRNALSSSYDKYLSGTPRAKTKSFWQEEDVATALYRQRREMEERREASRRELEEQIRRAQQNSITPVKQGSDAGFLEKTGETVLDVFGNILSGASKALEGVFDLGISGVGAIGGIFDKGFRDEMRRWVEYDVTGQHVQSTFDRWSDDSILNNSKAGQVTENVLQGVGQMLPTVLLSVATGGAAASVMLGASAAGNATEEAWNEGADYYRGLGYGLLTGGIEAGIEMATGGVAGLGVGYLDNILPSLASKTAATGVRRVLGNMAGEAAEEAVAELVNPLAKTIYKGRDALDDYSKAEYWQGVGESALVGGLTSAAYGATVGRAVKASGKYGDVRETVDDIKANRQKRANLDAHDKWTDAREEAFHKREVANYRQIEKILQSATPKQRATMIKQNNLDGAFDADGSLTADFLRSLGENVVDGQTDTQGENGAQGAPTGATEQAAHNHQYMSPDLWRREVEVQREIAKISQDSGEDISVLARDLSDEGKKHHKKLKQAFATLSEVSGGKLQMVVVEKNSTFTGAYAHGDTVYISADAVESGKWGEALIEESVHFAQGTQEHSLLRAFLADDTALLVKIESELTKEGNDYGFTVEDAAAFRAYLDGDADTELTGRALRYSNELTAHMSAELLSNEAVIDRLVGQHATLAEKILIKFKQFGRAFAKDKALAKRVADAEQIYLAAIERRGWKYVDGKIVGAKDEEESTIDYSHMNDKSFVQNVNEILNMSDEDAKRNAEEGNFVQVMPNTPALVREYVKNAEDLPIIIRFDALYLATRHDGALQGHYHNLGADIMPKLPDIIAHPDAIVKMKNGRVNLYSQFTTAKGKNGIISVELNTVKDINSKYSKYNLVVTVLPAKDTYAQNNLMNNAVAVAYEKEDLSQVNPQLHKWLAIVNDKSSTTIITENSDLSTPKTDFRAKEQTSDDSRELSLADLRAMDERDAKRENRFVKGSLSEVSDTLAKSADLKRGHKTELLTKLNDLYEYMAGSEVDGEVVATEIERIAVWMAEQRVQVEIEREAGYAQMLDMLKEARVTLTEAQRLAAANEHGSFSKYRNRVWGKIKLVSDGMPLATLWREWNEKYPSVFAEDVAEDLMPEELLHVIERADESRSDKYLAEMEMRETDEEMILRMYEEIYEGFFNVRQKATPEERYNAAMFKEKEAHREERDALRSENRELSEQHERDERVMARLTARKNAMEEDARESRRMTAEAAKAATAERHERERAESKLETARKRNERLKARNEAVEQDARESRRKAAEAAKKTAEAKTKHKIIARLTHDNGPLHKLYELRKGRFFSAQIYQSDILQGIPTKMASIKESALISGSARTVISEVRDWYCDVENTMLYRKAGSEDADGQQTGTVEYDPTIAEFLESIASGEGEFTLDELRALESIAGHFVTIAQKYRSVLKDGKYVDGEPIARKYVSKISDAKKNETGFVRLMRSKYLRQFGDPLSLVKSFDAYDAEGYFTETYRELREAAVNMAVREMDILMGYRQFHDKHKKWAKRMINDAVHFRGNNIPLGHAISLYMTAKREQSMRGLVESGFAYNNTKGERVRLPGFDPELEATLKDDLNAKDIKLTKEQFAEEYRARIEARCKTAERELWASFDEDTRTYVKLIEASFDGDCRRVKIDTDKAQQGYSTVSEDGYYYPSVRAQVAKELHAGRYEGDRVSHLSLNKETVEGARGELLIEAVDRVYLRHVRNLCLYADMSAFIENQNVLRNLDVSGNVRKAVTIKSEIEASGKQHTEMQRFMDKLIKDIQKIPGEASDEQSLWKETVEFLRGSYAKFQLGANPKVLVTQFSSLFAASSRLDYSCLLSGLGTASGDVDKYCRLAELRNSENTAALASGVLTEMTNKIGDKLMMGIGKIDRLVVTRLFGACQQQIAKDKGLKVGSEENKIEAGRLLTEVILDTQQNSLATERSDAMRSSDTLLRSLTMFSADAMKVFGRFADGWGRSLTLSKRLKNTTDAKARVAIEAELKEARREFRRAAGALVASSVFMALIAQLFRDLYAKDDDKELDERVADITIDALGNMVGGLPILRDVASYLTDGYEVDNFMLSTFNDVLVASTDVLGLAGDAIGGKDISSQDVAKTTRKAVYAVGQVFGIPIRNGYNLVTGLSSRFSKKAKYWNENLFYKQSYTNDLQTAMDAGDERMIALIASMMMDERVGDVDKTLSDGLRPLVEGGYDVLPRALGDSIAYDGEEIVLTKRQKKRFREVYAIAEEQIASMMALRQYKEADDEVRARAIKLIWEAYYDLAMDDVLGVDSAEKNVLFAEAIDMDKLALIIATARGIKADVGANGKAINGSRLAKIEKYVESLKLKAAQKYMVMGYLGYKNKNGEDKVRAYINTLSALSKEEKRLLLEFSGYAAA